MFYTYQQLLNKYKNYSNPKMKIKRLVSEGKLTNVLKGIYSDKINYDTMVASSIICGPSYISFEQSASLYSLIPEGTYGEICAYTGKDKNKTFFDENNNRYIYRNVPENRFYFGIESYESEEGIYYIANLEKTFLDLLTRYPIAENLNDFKHMLFTWYRIDFDIFASMNKRRLMKYVKFYKGKNFRILEKHYEEIIKNEE